MSKNAKLYIGETLIEELTVTGMVELGAKNSKSSIEKLTNLYKEEVKEAQRELEEAKSKIRQHGNTIPLDLHNEVVEAMHKIKRKKKKLNKLRTKHDTK